MNVFKNIDLRQELKLVHSKIMSQEEKLLHQAQQLLRQDLYSNKSVLENLSNYNKSFEDLDERNLESENIFHLSEIKKLAILNRIKFLDAKFYKPEFPYSANLMIQQLNDLNRKEVKSFKILAPAVCFRDPNAQYIALLFAKTSDDNYYLVHHWGKELPWYRKILYWPLRNFEKLVSTIVFCTIVITLTIPTRLITLDHQATYWSGYRAAAFFHLLIFNFGVTVYITFTFAKNFSEVVWNRYKDFD